MKLKPILPHTVVHTPTEAEAKELLEILHENGYEWYHKYAPIPNPNLSQVKYISIYQSLHGCKNVITYYDKRPFETYLTLAEFKKKYCEEEPFSRSHENGGKENLDEDNFAKSDEEKPQPKFRLGERIRIVSSGEEDFINMITKDDCYELLEHSGKYIESDLEPYAEPETKPIEEPPLKMTAAEGLCAMAKAEMGITEIKELNLCELLEGHTEEIFYSPFFGEVEVRIEYDDAFPIVVNGEHLTTDGRLYLNEDCMPSIFPSRDLYEQYPLDPYTAWMKWYQEQKKITLQICYAPLIPDNVPLQAQQTVMANLNFRTPADRDKCIEVIDALLKQIQQSKSVASLCEEIKAIIEKYSKK